MPATRLSATARPLLLIAFAAALLLGVVLVTTPSADAAASGEPVAHELALSPSDGKVNDGGVNGSGAAEWLTFAIPLGAFLLLIVPLVWITFGIDRSEGRE